MLEFTSVDFLKMFEWLKLKEFELKRLLDGFNYKLL